MNSREKFQARVFVLRMLDYGESDLIVTFYSREYGKIKGIAKGARRSRKRFANTLELFSLSEIIFSRRDPTSLALIEESNIIDHLGNIRNVLENTLLASYMVELVDHFTIEGKVNPDIYGLLEGYLGRLDRGFEGGRLMHFFELDLLKIAGYEPVLDRCLNCRQPVNPQAVYLFSPRDGGIRCDACAPSSPSSFPVALGTIRTLLYGKDLEKDKLARVVISEQSSRESRLIFSRVIEHILGRKIKSYAVLCEITGTNGNNGRR